MYRDILLHELNKIDGVYSTIRRSGDMHISINSVYEIVYCIDCSLYFLYETETDAGNNFVPVMNEASCEEVLKLVKLIMRVKDDENN